MIAWIARKLAFTVVYGCEWGEYAYRYDDLDHHMMRPVHKDMSVAPPWAKTVFRRT